MISPGAIRRFLLSSRPVSRSSLNYHYPIRQHRKQLVRPFSPICSLRLLCQSSPERSDFSGQIPVSPVAMTQSTIVRKSLNPFSRQTWVRGWRKIRTYQFRVADRVNARSGWLARRIRWPLGVGSPDRWPEVHVFRMGGIGDLLTSTPALRLLKQIRPQIPNRVLYPLS